MLVRSLGLLIMFSERVRLLVRVEWVGRTGRRSFVQGIGRLREWGGEGDGKIGTIPLRIMKVGVTGVRGGIFALL